MYQRKLYWPLIILGVFIGLLFIAVSLVAYSSKHDPILWLTSVLGACFLVYGLFGQAGLRRIKVIVFWPFLVPVSLFFVIWSLNQLWLAVTVQEIQTWPYSDTHFWSVEPVYFSLVLVLQVFILIQGFGILYASWMLARSRKKRDC